MKKLAAFMAAVMVMTGVSTMSAGAISINCPVEGQWVSMSCTAEGTQWFMADGSVVTEDKNGNITQTAPTKPATTTSSDAGNTTNSTETASENSWIPKGYTVDPSIKNGSYNHIIEQLIFDYTNEERVKAGLPKLVWSAGLTEYAEIRAKEIMDNYSHVREEGSYSGGAEIIYRFGMHACDLSKNKNVDMTEVARYAVNGWMNSDGHREVIMDYEVDEYGDTWGSQSVAVGVYVENDAIYAVQVFDAGIGTVGTTVFDDLEAGLTISPLLVGEDLERYNELIESN